MRLRAPSLAEAEVTCEMTVCRETPSRPAMLGVRQARADQRQDLPFAIGQSPPAGAPGAGRAADPGRAQRPVDPGEQRHHPELAGPLLDALEPVDGIRRAGATGRLAGRPLAADLSPAVVAAPRHAGPVECLDGCGG